MRRVIGQVRTSNSDSKEASIKGVIVYYSSDIGTQATPRNASGFTNIDVAPNSLRSLDVYPNPAYHSVTVYTHDANAKIVISATNGEIVRRSRSTSTRTLIDIKTLQATV
jgi:hypothetical protein